MRSLDIKHKATSEGWLLLLLTETANLIGLAGHRRRLSIDGRQYHPTATTGVREEGQGEGASFVAPEGEGTDLGPGDWRRKGV